jgi:hypothetical protein
LRSKIKIPAGHTEESVLEAIYKVVNYLAPGFVFGHYGLDDVKQEGVVMALELLEKETYDPSRPLENYLYIHLSRRYINFKRNKLTRCDAPCASCHAGQPCTPSGVCQKYSEWKARNRAKANAMCPQDLHNISDEKEDACRVHSSVVEDAEISELTKLIDKELPVGLRAAYLQMRAGVPVPKAKRLEVEEAVKIIVGGALCQDVED